MDKKILRKFANDDPAPAIPPNHGLLHAQQVDHIIRADVRIIGHRRTLIIYIFDRKQATTGNPVPLWTMFHVDGDYITLVREPDGASRWREASFERLGNDYRFTDKCAFYSAKDEQRVCDYFRDGERGGIAALIRAQQAILDERARKRKRRRDQAVRERMKCLPALSRGLATWAHKTIMPAYFIYDHARKGKASGICSSCGQEAVLTGVKHNAEGICPHCGRTLTMKPRGRIGRLYDRQTFNVLQRTKTGELAVRIMKATCAYYGDSPGTAVYESARQFFRVSPGGAVHCDRYYYAHGESKWKRGERPGMFPYQYNFETDTCGHVYCDDLPKALSGTPWEYCPVQAFYEHYHEPMQMQPFLFAYLEHPKLEHLVKVGFCNLASDLAYRSCYGLKLDESQNRTHRILNVGAEDVDFLRKLDVDQAALKIFQGYCERNLKDRQQLLAWRWEWKVERDIDPALNYMTVHKLIRYLDAQWPFLQYRLTEYKARRYHSMQDLVTEYKDYLDMCRRLDYDIKNSFVLYPKDLQKAHDRVQRRVRIKADSLLRRDFEVAMKSISRRLDFEMDGLRIVVPSNPDEIIAEGNALHHCVGGYVERVAKKECVILFLRRCEEVDKPFYTVEVRNRKAVQVRGMQNADMTPEVKRFMDNWERQVLMAA